MRVVARFGRPVFLGFHSEILRNLANEMAPRSGLAALLKKVRTLSVRCDISDTKSC